MFDSLSRKVPGWWDAALRPCGAPFTKSCVKTSCAGNEEIVLSFDVRSETLGIADKRNGVVLPVFKVRSSWTRELFTVVPKVFVPRMPLEVLEGIARTASEEAQKSANVEL